MKLKEKTPGIAVKLLDFKFDLFSDHFNDKLVEFLTSDANVNMPVCQVKWERWQQTEFMEIRRILGMHKMTVPAGDGSDMPAPSLRGLKRSLSATHGEGEEEEDANDRHKEIEMERKRAWGDAQTHRKKWCSASSIKTDRLTKEHIDQWFQKQTAAHDFQGVPGKSHRVFVLSAERSWGVETGPTPWNTETPWSPSLEMIVEWLLERTGPSDALLVFDGRSESIREQLREKMRKARHLSDIWLVYSPRKEPATRKTIFSSRNREVGWISFPVARNCIQS